MSGVTTSESEAADKRIWHKRARAKQRQRLVREEDPFPVLPNEVITPWGMAKDGKVRWDIGWRVRILDKVLRK